jgi:20S proteasome alpha/beta subunit
MFDFLEILKLTTIIAIKCIDGLVMASDRQGTAGKIKLLHKKFSFQVGAIS